MRRQQHQRVALTDIRSLTLHAGKQTTARRTAPVPQLTCVGPKKLCKLFSPHVVRCWNNGGEGVDVDWTCEADLPEALRFGEVEVSCEGWDRPGDPYVLKGSCGLNYRLVDMSGGKAASLSGDAMQYIFLIIVLGMALIGLFYCFCNGRSTSRNGRPYDHGGGHGGSRSQPPPPPYTPHPESWKNASGGAGPSSSDRWWRGWGGRGHNERWGTFGSRNGDSGGDGAGFWQGVGLGGLAGAAAASLWQRRASSAPPTTSSTWRTAPSAFSPRPRAFDSTVVEDEEYDWERRRRGAGANRGWFGSGMGAPSSVRHQGAARPSNMGDTGGFSSTPGASSSRMRTSRGFGTTNVR